MAAHSLTSGWLNRALGALHGAEGIALGASIPLLLQGPGEVTSWSPDLLPGADTDLLARVEHLYQADPLLRRALAEAQRLRADSHGAPPPPERPGFGRRSESFESLMRKAGELLGGDAGLRLGSIEIGGWDTHVGQGLDRGRLADAMRQLSAGVTALRGSLGPAWQKTAVLAVTEFGRTVKGNGTGGSDHGTGTVALLMGGGVAGGRVVGDWPGVAPHQLYQGRDLHPANDLRALLQAVLVEHLGLGERAPGGAIFPGPTEVSPLRGLFRRETSAV